MAGRGFALVMKGRAIEAAADGLHQDQGKGDLAIADFRKAIELQPKTFFDMAAQADAKKRVQTLGNQLPCRGAGNAAGQTCL